MEGLNVIEQGVHIPAVVAHGLDRLLHPALGVLCQLHDRPSQAINMTRTAEPAELRPTPDLGEHTIDAVGIGGDFVLLHIAGHEDRPVERAGKGGQVQAADALSSGLQLDAVPELSVVLGVLPQQVDQVLLGLGGQPGPERVRPALWAFAALLGRAHGSSSSEACPPGPSIRRLARRAARSGIG